MLKNYRVPGVQLLGAEKRSGSEFRVVHHLGFLG